MKVHFPGNDGTIFKFRTTQECPQLVSLDEAQQVLAWCKETGYIGVMPVVNGGFRVYFVLGGSVHYVANFQYDTARLAAGKHDALARENSDLL